MPGFEEKWRGFCFVTGWGNATLRPTHSLGMSQPSFNAPGIEILGRLLRAYDFECLIAKGGMGAVYKAKQRSLARDVAIKVLPPEVGRDPLFRRSFETEAHAMARLNHPNLIGVYDSGEVDGMLYIVMEYVPGKSLYHSSYGKMVDPVQAVQLIRGICAGLGHAHENGIIHRDIKPANILLTPKAEPKIGDFGLARLAGSEGSGLVMGTPGYTAPEVIANPHVTDHRCDLFSVGIILYELMTGRPAETVPPSTLCACGPGMDAIWRRATELNPANRFQSASAFSAALVDWLATTDAAAKRKGGMPGPIPQGKGGMPAAVSPGKNGMPAAPQAKGGMPASQVSAMPKPQANPASQVQPKKRGTGISVFLQILFFGALLGATAYLWNRKEQQDRKNEANFEEYKRSRAESHPSGSNSSAPPRRSDPPGIPGTQAKPPQGGSGYNPSAQPPRPGNEPNRSDPNNTPGAVRTPNPNVLKALAALREPTMENAKETVRLLEVAQKAEPDNQNISKIKNLVMEVFRKEFNLNKALADKKAADAEFNIRKNNYAMAKQGSGVNRWVNWNDVARIEKEAKEAMDKVRKAEKDIETGKAGLRDLLSAGHFEISSPEREFLLPTWKSIASRNGILPSSEAGSSRVSPTSSKPPIPARHP